jgi:hypothetical protein
MMTTPCDPTDRSLPDQSKPDQNFRTSRAFAGPGRTIWVSGDSDDSVILHDSTGRCIEEFLIYNTSPGSPEGVLTFSDGTVLRVRPDGTGDCVWTITIVDRGTATVTIDPAPTSRELGLPDYTERAVITGQITWVSTQDGNDGPRRVTL